MKKIEKKGLALLAAFSLVCLFSTAALAATTAEINSAFDDTAAYLRQNVDTPQVSSSGGEWVVIGLARSGYSVPQSYYDAYYTNLEHYLTASGGVLHERKYSEYSRVILALSAIGKDPTNVMGYNLLTSLTDYDKTIWQGVNGAIYALLALDSGNYGTETLKKQYLDYILSAQLKDGGWALSGDTADPDITAMALQALAKYQGQNEVDLAISQGLSRLSAIQDERGGFSSYGIANCESTAQVIVALCELGIALDDRRFIKNGITLADNLLSYYTKGNGFAHIKNGKTDQIATEQAFCSLVAIERRSNHQNSLFTMNADTVFSDIAGHPDQEAIEALAQIGVIKGMGDGIFAPDAQMTRAQFAAVVTRALNLPGQTHNTFTDVPNSAWYAGYIGAAYQAGIVKGTSATTFYPDGIIIHAHAALMVERAADGIGLAYHVAVNEDLAQTPISRGELAAILYGMMLPAGLI